MKIVINTCYGGFGLSDKAQDLFKRIKGLDDPNWYDREVNRADPVLISVVEDLGEAANSSYSILKIVEVPDEVDWVLQEYDGKEWIAETHRTWS